MNIGKDLSSHSELAGDLFVQLFHILPDLVIGDLGVYLGNGNLLVIKHLIDRFQPHTLR